MNKPLLIKVGQLIDGSGLAPIPQAFARIEGMPVVEESTTVHADVLCGDSCAA